MKSYWHPKITTFSQQKAKEQSSSASVKEAQPILAGVTGMAVSKDRGQCKSSRPESNAARQRVQGIATVTELLFQRDNDESKAIKCAPFPNLDAAQGHRSKAKNSSEP